LFFDAVGTLGNNSSGFVSKRGDAVVVIDPGGGGAYVAAGQGENEAQVFLPARQEVVDRMVPVEVNRPLYKRKSSWCICLLIMIILLVLGGIAAGVAIHLVRKNSSSSTY
jgi:hypothetical protein